jgi:hypothetical protein
MKPVCVPCERFFRPAKNGFAFVEGKPTSNGAKPGKAEPEHWQPYKLWMGDRWECPDCGASIIVGFAQHPISEDYHQDFTQRITDWGGGQLLVKDC